MVILESLIETNQVNDALLYKNCEGRLSDPKILPCGETISSLCETNKQTIDKMYECLACKKTHEISQDGLPNNKLNWDINYPISFLPLNYKNKQKVNN